MDANMEKAIAVVSKGFNFTKGPSALKRLESSMRKQNITNPFESNLYRVAKFASEEDLSQFKNQWEFRMGANIATGIDEIRLVSLLSKPELNVPPILRWIQTKEHTKVRKMLIAPEKVMEFTCKKYFKRKEITNSRIVNLVNDLGLKYVRNLVKAYEDGSIKNNNNYGAASHEELGKHLKEDGLLGISKPVQVKKSVKPVKFESNVSKYHKLLTIIKSVFAHSEFKDIGYVQILKNGNDLKVNYKEEVIQIQNKELSLTLD